MPRAGIALELYGLYEEKKLNHAEMHRRWEEMTGHASMDSTPKGGDMNRLKWVGPHLLRDYLGGLLAMTGNVWPPSRPGVYAVSKELWTGQPSSGPVLYTGGTGNLLNRIADLIRDVLGFYGPVENGTGWVGQHSGGQLLWAYCDKHGFPVGDLVIGWAATSVPCHWCMEAEIARLLKPSENRRTGGRKCCCCPPEAA